MDKMAIHGLKKAVLALHSGGLTVKIRALFLAAPMFLSIGWLFN